MNSFMSSTPLSPFTPTRRAVQKSRRDFLTWLAAGTAMTAVGCAADASDDAQVGGGRDEDPAIGGGAEEETVEIGEYGQTVCRTTTRDARGPYWEPGAPVRTTRIAELDEPGVRLFVEGRLLGPDCPTLLKGYTLDIWQADRTGSYHAAEQSDHRLRGKIKTDVLGRYRFETILPGRYGDAAGIRPAHLHVSFLSPGDNVLLTTQLYFEGDPYLGQADYCTRSRVCNSADRNRVLKLRDALVWGRAGKRAMFDAVLART